MQNETKGGLLYLHALTAVHPGSGTALGVVDLPIQRERHTGWPVIPGSTVKGVLRQAADPAIVEKLFGRAGEDGGFYAGALAITDARLLAFPVRSLRGVFVWATCTQALQRWARDATLVGQTLQLPELAVNEDEALIDQQSPCIDGGALFLEEYRFAAKPLGHIPGWPALAGFDPKRVAVLGDTDFCYFTQHATEVTARIKLDPGSKTVTDGALFYEEFLPAETLLYSVVIAASSRDKEKPGSADEMLTAFRPPPHLQIGGNETTGKGLCAVGWEKGA